MTGHVVSDSIPKLQFGYRPGGRRDRGIWNSDKDYFFFIQREH